MTCGHVDGILGGSSSCNSAIGKWRENGQLAAKHDPTDVAN
jgi:hypothetical protein